MPTPFPATRTTKRSLDFCWKIVSIGTRASEQPSTAAKGRWTGATPGRTPCPTSLGSSGMTRALPGESSRCANERLPFISFAWASLGLRGARRRDGRSGSNRYTTSIVREDRRSRVKPASGEVPTSNRTRLTADRGATHELVRHVASREPRAGDLPDPGRRLRDRAGADRQLPSRQRGGDAPRRRPRRPARREDRPAGQDGLLRPLPLRHRLQGRAAVLPWPQEERGVPGAADPRAVRGEPGHDGGGREGHGVRRRHRGGAARRGLHRVDRHRHRRQHDLAPGPARGRDDAPAQQHPRGLRGQLPRGDELRGLVPLEPRAAAARA